MSRSKKKNKKHKKNIKNKNKQGVVARMETNSFDAKNFNPASTTFLFEDEDPFFHRSVKEVVFGWKHAGEAKKIKVKAVTKEGKEAEITYQEVLPFELSGSFLDSVLFRVKSVFVSEMLGSYSSDFVETKSIFRTTQEKNQFRIKAVSTAKNPSHRYFTTDWIYSNIRNFDNESFLFELLNECIEWIAMDEKKENVLNYFVDSFLEKLTYEEKFELFFSIEPSEYFPSYWSEKSETELFLELKEKIIQFFFESEPSVFFIYEPKENWYIHKMREEQKKIIIQKWVVEALSLVQMMMWQVEELNKSNQIKETKSVSLFLEIKNEGGEDQLKNLLKQKKQIVINENIKEKNEKEEMNEEKETERKEDWGHNLKESGNQKEKKEMKFNMSVKSGRREKEKIESEYKEISKEQEAKVTEQFKKLFVFFKEINQKEEIKKQGKEEKRSEEKKEIERTEKKETKKKIEKMLSENSVIEKKEKPYNIYKSQRKEKIKTPIKEDLPVMYIEDPLGVAIGEFILDQDELI
jgi:hypothetical protein